MVRAWEASSSTGTSATCDSNRSRTVCGLPGTCPAAVSLVEVGTDVDVVVDVVVEFTVDVDVTVEVEASVEVGVEADVDEAEVVDGESGAPPFGWPASSETKTLRTGAGR
jgi:hypothetical protein